MKANELYELDYTLNRPLREARHAVADKFLLVSLCLEQDDTLSEENRKQLEEAKAHYLKTFCDLLTSDRLAMKTGVMTY